MRTAWIGAFALALLLVACAAPQPQPAAPQPQPVQMQTKFDSDMHKPYTQKGNNTIKGQGFLRQQGGGIVTCAGRDVRLIPATPYFREFFSLLRSGKKPTLDKFDPAYKAMVKHSQGDAQGNFTFSDVPNGNWFVLTSVQWIVASKPQGGELLKEVSVANGETKQVLLTDKDLLGR